MARLMRSDEIEFLRFALIAGLVFLHYGALPGTEVSPFRGAQLGPYPVASTLNAFVLFFFFSAVPLLSAVSGYLFFRNADLSPRFFADRYAKRARSILLPMVAWNAITLSLFALAAAAKPDWGGLSIVTYDVRNLDVPDILNALLGITRHPINFQFWFLSDLLLTILVAPVLGLLLARAPYLGAVGLGLVWLGGYDLGIFFRTDVLFFFYVGALIALRVGRLPTLRVDLALALFVVYVGGVALRTVAPLVIDENGPWTGPLLDIATRALRAVGVLAFWGLVPIVARTAFGRGMVTLAPLAFFLFAAHWPLNQFIKGALAGVLPVGTDAWLIVNFVLTSGLTIAVAVIAALLLDRVAPGVFAVLSGGRSSPVTRAERPALREQGAP